jgi:hypothetical protein
LLGSRCRWRKRQDHIQRDGCFGLPLFTQSCWLHSSGSETNRSLGSEAAGPASGTTRSGDFDRQMRGVSPPHGLESHRVSSKVGFWESSRSFRKPRFQGMPLFRYSQRVPIYRESNDSSTSNDPSYEEDWRLYYAQRRSIFKALAACAVGAAVSASIIAVVPNTTQSKHATTVYVVGAVGALFLLATAFQWFRFVWVLGGWTCPRCRETFFRSTIVRNPFGRHCRHCNLRRPSRSEVVPAPRP